MNEIAKLLKYQEEDSKLLKIEKEAQSSDEWKNFSQSKAFLTKVPDKLDAMDAKARELEVELKKIEKKYGDIVETLKDYENLDDLVDEGADISFYKKSATNLTEKLKSIRAEINAISKSIKTSDDEYQALKKKTILVQKQYTEFSVAYQDYKKSKIEEMDKVKAELKRLAADISPDVLKRYEVKRSERIFPIICAVANGRCSKCGNELSIAGKEKIERGGVCECENCHRFLYKQ